MFVVAGLTIASIGLGSWMATRDTNTAALTMVVGFATLAPFVAARPTVFSYALLSLLVVVVRVERLWWVAVPLIWVWGSVHGSFPVGIGLLVLVAVALKSRKLFAIAALSAVTVTLGAHGFAVVDILQAFLENRDALSVISEWQRPDFANPFLLPFVVVVLGVVLAFTRKRLVAWDLIVIGPFVVYALVAERNIPHAAIVLLAGFGGGWASRRGRAAQKPQRTPSPGERRLVAWGLVVVALIGAVGLTRTVGWSPSRFPSPAVTDALARSEVLTDPAVGGYLVYVGWPEQPIFIDDRAELFGSKIVDVARALDGDAGVIAAYDLDQVLVRRDGVLADRLRAAGWTTKADDEQWVLLGR
ncbi:hypothetical protein BMS3Bbin02_00063 [bacterium BMS3Bbin02]|nr:hypothetical protein BMS3Bbin02_00063 [bacterium BMS3Bbin02]